MIAIDLIHKLNTKYGVGEWPPKIEVDGDTYGHCCQYVFNHTRDADWFGFHRSKSISFGPNGYLMFKNIELILNRDLSDGDIK